MPLETVLHDEWGILAFRTMAPWGNNRNVHQQMSGETNHDRILFHLKKNEILTPMTKWEKLEETFSEMKLTRDRQTSSGCSHTRHLRQEVAQCMPRAREKPGGVARSFQLR